MAEQSIVEVGNAMILLASADGPLAMGVQSAISDFTTNGIDQSLP